MRFMALRQCFKKGLNKMRLEKLTLRSNAIPIQIVGSSDEFKSCFQSTVRNHLALFPWPNPGAHFLFLVTQIENAIPHAYHYFYLDEERSYCELFAVFVEQAHRSNGLASKLISDAARHARTMGAKYFNLRFSDENAGDGKLVQNLKHFALTEFKESNMTFYYGDERWNN